MRASHGGDDHSAGLYVIHEIKPKSFRSARVQRGEDSRLAVGGDLGHLLEAGIAQHLHGEFAPFIHAAIFRRNGRLLYPGLHPLHAFVMALGDLRPDGSKVILEWREL